MNAILDNLGLNAEQLRIRKDAIGGSDANTIMSGNDARLLRLWREKRGEVEGEDLSDNLAVQMGSFTEPLNVAWFEKSTGMTVKSRGVVARRKWEGHPMAATLDGECGFDGPDAVFEAKHCGTRSTDAELFARYVPQLTHNCLCAGRSRAFLSAFKGNGDWVMFEYTVDDDYAARLVEAEAAFWECVRTGKPPCAVEAEPTPKPVGVVEYDMEALGNNAWASFAGEYLETRIAADRHDTAKKELKELVPADASKCFGHGIIVKRDKRGALRFTTTGEE